MTKIQKQLKSISDREYAAFSAKLTPTVSPELFLGVRVPKLREFAKSIKADEAVSFMHSLPHKYYDENLLHSILLNTIKDYDTFIDEIEAFLPYIDNWAVNDTIKPKCVKKHKNEFLKKIKVWAKSKETYVCRFGVSMLMGYFLDEDFQPKFLKIVSSIKSDEYYVNMMNAWYFATALAKQWDYVIPYIENNKLPVWVHNKTIQKAVESYRITEEQKAYLKSLRRKQ